LQRRVSAERLERQADSGVHFERRDLQKLEVRTQLTHQLSHDEDDGFVNVAVYDLYFLRIGKI